MYFGQISKNEIHFLFDVNYKMYMG